MNKISRGSQYFIYEKEQLIELFDTKDVLCNEDIDSGFAFAVYSKYQDMVNNDTFICTVRESDRFDRFMRKCTRVIVPEGTKYLEIYPWHYIEMKDTINEKNEHLVSIIRPDDIELPLELLSISEHDV